VPRERPVPGRVGLAIRILHRLNIQRRRHPG
jgi:hypothetical protein